MKKPIIIILAVLFLSVNVFGQSEDDFQIVQNRQGTITITGYTGTEKNVTIPTTIEGISVTTIENEAFLNKQLTGVTIPNSVTSIGLGAFAYNQLTNVIISDSVTSIRAGAFRNNQLSSVTIPNSVTSIGISAFANNQLTSVTIPNSVTVISREAFANNQLTSITIPNSVTSIGDSAFAGNHLASVTLGDDINFSNNTFHNNLNDFYFSQDKKAGTYTWTGRIWRVN